MDLSQKRILQQAVFWLVAGLVVATNWVSPPLALLAGLVLGLALGNPYPDRLGIVTRYALQISVVGLGFGINLYQVAETGLPGFFYTLVTLLITLGLGFLLAKVLGVGQKMGDLISAGTAICGGSAIAAVAPAIRASQQDISVALGVVFILNAVALLVFPVVGAWLGLSQQQFGVWAAIAIHDTSSVVGAATLFGEEALKIATTLKLTRALWILPLVLVAGLLYKTEERKAAFPRFILFFLAASVAGTLLNDLAWVFALITHLAKKGLILSLFFIGTGISLALLRSISLRPFLQGLLLWVLVAAGSLAGVYYFIN